MQDLLNTENLIKLHEKLNKFAKYHQNKGGQEAHELIKAMWNESKELPRNGTPDGLLRDEGYDYAIKCILKMLHVKFRTDILF